MTIESSTILTLQEVGHAFDGANYLFRHLTTSIEFGSRTAIVGPSGSGKSTLLAIIAGTLVPSEGRRAVSQHEPTQRLVFQNPHGVSGRTALDHVVLPLLAVGLRRTDAEPKATNLLSQFDLQACIMKSFSQLSGGERQRLLLCRALAAEPQLLLVDEPTAQLDRDSAERVNAVLAALSKTHRTAIVIATHDPGTRAACDTVLDLAEFR